MPPKKYTIRLDNPPVKEPVKEPVNEEIKEPVKEQVKEQVKVSAIDSYNLKKAETGHLFTPLPKQEVSIDELKHKKAMIEGNLSMPSYEKKKQLADLTFSIKIKEHEEKERLEELNKTKKRVSKKAISPIQTLPEKELQKIKKRELKKYVKRLIVESSDSDTDQQSSSDEEEKESLHKREGSPSVKKRVLELTKEEIKAIRKVYLSSSESDAEEKKSIEKGAVMKVQREKRGESRENDSVVHSKPVEIQYALPSFKGIRRR